jgi:diguanylate cyclase (GGDEF)-like protein/PAS domain S-box-containing protein
MNCENEDVLFRQYIMALLMHRELPDAFDNDFESMPEGEKQAILSAVVNIRKALKPLSEGDLKTVITGDGYVLNLMKKLQASLKHIVYQSDAISEGSFVQSMDFMGELSDAFNKMVYRLDDAFTASERHRMKAEESERRHRLLADNATDVIWTMNMMGQFTYVSPSVMKLRGYTPEEVMAHTVEETLCPGSITYMVEGLKVAREHIQAGSRMPVFRGQLEQPRKDGSTVWTEATISGIYDESNNFVELLGISRDISAQKKLEAEIIKISTTDKLTQIYNRLKMESLLESAFNDAYTKGACFQVAIFDIDKFKRVNDRYGHPTGDLVLVELSQYVAQTVKGYANVAFGRWGGEEFMLVINGMQLDEAGVLLERIRAGIEQYEYSIAETVTCSFGMAQLSAGMSLTDLILRADQAMYKAKSNGRNRVEIDDKAGACLSIETIIRI